MIELHLHLDGSLSKEDIDYLSKKNNLPYDENTPLTVNEDIKRRGAYFTCFDYPIALMQDEDSLEYATYSLYKRLSKEGIFYAEVRYAPSQQIFKGLTQEQVVQATIRGYQKAHKETGILGGLILCIMRFHDFTEKNIDTIEVARKYLGKGVLALDIAGDEERYPFALFQNEFELIKKYHLPFTAHAGETMGPENVWAALKVGATRIGHGIHAYQDPSLIDHLVRHDILMEICPSSELDTGCVSSLSEIHLRDLMKAGVKIAIGADDTMVSATNLKREFDLLEKEYHLTDEEIITFWKNAIDHAFCDEPTKKTLRKKLSALLK